MRNGINKEKDDTLIIICEEGLACGQEKEEPSFHKYSQAVTGTELVPGVMASIQTFRQKINLHPHLHCLVIASDDRRVPNRIFLMTLFRTGRRGPGDF